MDGDAPTNALPNPIVDLTAGDPEHTPGGDQEPQMTAPTDLADTPVSDEDKTDRTLRALQVVAISGFVGNIEGTEASCLSLCNACREGLPLERLRIHTGVPPSLLAIVCPGPQQRETRRSGRVLPPRKVLRVHLWFDDSYNPDCCSEQEEEPTVNNVERDGGSVEGCETGLVVDVNREGREVQWPEGTKEVALCFFNRRMNGVTLPEGLERLGFGDSMLNMSLFIRVPDLFNKPLDGVTFPSGLREIFLGESFNQLIEGMVWPGGLQRLSLPGFNQSIRDVQWPPGLKALEFVSPSTIKLWDREDIDDTDFVHPDHIAIVSQQRHGRFNQPLATTLPPSLETLWLPNEFQHSLESVAWPSGIVTLGLAFDFQVYAYSGSITWPSNLQLLCMVNKPDEEMRYPHDSEVAVLRTFEEEGLANGQGLDCYRRGEDPNDSQDDEGDVTNYEAFLDSVREMCS